MRNKAKKFLSLVLSLSMVLSLLCVAASADAEPVTADETWGTDYETETEFTIEDAADLLQFAVLVNGGKNFQDKTVTLTGDIDLTDAVWMPIGNNSNPFKGTFDGGEKTVKNLNPKGNTYCGLFGYVSGGTVENLSIRGNMSDGCPCYAGFAVGYLNGENALVRNISVNAAISYTNSATGIYGLGGVVGFNTSGTIDGCSYEGSISSTTNNNGRRIGGVVGYNNGGTVRNCYNLATITAGSSDVGGIAGASQSTQNNGHKSLLENCYNWGDVTGHNTVGGIVGDNSSSATTENCVNGGRSYANYWAAGEGSIGGNKYNGTVKNSYGLKGTTRNDAIAPNATVTNCEIFENTDVAKEAILSKLNDWVEEKNKTNDIYKKWFFNEGDKTPVFDTRKDISCIAADYSDTYDGSAHGISLTVTAPASGYTIKYRTESEGNYTLTTAPTYTNATATPVTVYYQITADGYRPVTGSNTVTIAPKSFSDDATKDDFIVELTGNPLKENGEEQTQNFTVKDQKNGVGGTALTEDVDFTVSTDPDKDNKGTDAGEYTMEITGKGNYTGTLSKEFTILEKDIPPVAETGLVYNGSEQALFTDGTASGGEMKYFVLKADAKPGTDPDFAWDTSANVKQTDAGIYQVWYCVVVASETPSPIYLGAVTIAPKSFSSDDTKSDFFVELTGDPLKENGTEQTQNFTVKDQKIGVGGTALTEDVDFTVSTDPDKDNKGTPAGEYTMEITGKGNYTGTLSKKFVILEADKDYSGSVVVIVPPQDGVPDTKLDTEKNTAIQAVATAEELSKVATGATLTISMEVSPLDEATLSAEVQSAVAEKTGDLTKGVYLDIDLFKQLNNEEKKQITETKVPLTITIDVPEEIQAQNRTYYIIREHEGQVDVIDGTYDETNKTLTFNTDKFSTYAIYYKDITLPAPATGGGTTTYKITGEDTVNGKLTISKKYAFSGTKITVTVESDRGYELTSLTVTAKNGKAVTITMAKDGGEYTFVMPGSDVVVSAKFTCTKDEYCPIAPFADSKPDSWYHDAVHFCIEEGLMNGITAESFAPYGTTTRGMVTTILYRLANCPAVSEATTYTDVKLTRYYADAIAWAEDYNVVLGYGNGKFGPEDCITREQMAALLYRYAGNVVGELDMEDGADLSNFKDCDKISAYAVPALRWAVKCGLMEGRPGNLLAPKDEISRAETATMIYRFIAILNL